MQSQVRSTSGDGGGSGYRSGAGWKLFGGVAQLLDQRLGCFKLPLPLVLLTLIGGRTVLRKRNLYDTAALPAAGAAPLPPWDPKYLTARSPDGLYNALDNPLMGRAGSRCGPNVPLSDAPRESPQDLMTPNPRTV